MVIIASQANCTSADLIECLLVTTAGLDTPKGGIALAAAGNYTDRAIPASDISEIIKIIKIVKL